MGRFRGPGEQQAACGESVFDPRIAARLVREARAVAVRSTSSRPARWRSSTPGALGASAHHPRPGLAEFDVHTMLRLPTGIFYVRLRLAHALPSAPGHPHPRHQLMT